jgi:hypothetical protein
MGINQRHGNRATLSADFPSTSSPKCKTNDIDRFDFFSLYRFALMIGKKSLYSNGIKQRHTITDDNLRCSSWRSLIGSITKCENDADGFVEKSELNE